MVKLRHIKAAMIIGGFFLTSGCSIGIPSPLKTGSWYYGEIDGDHVGFDVVFPWASRKQPKVEPKVNKP